MLNCRRFVATFALGAGLPVMAQTRPVLQAAPQPAPATTAPADSAASPATDQTVPGQTVPGQTPAQPDAGTAPGQAALAATEAMTGTPGTSSDTYIIGTGDTLQVMVWKEPSMSAPTVPVRPDGMISLPLVGDVQAANMTPMKLSQDIQARLKHYVQAPLVTVTVSSVRPKEIYLVGEIAHIGPVTLTGSMTPLQAIATAGGLTSFAKSKSIYILRKSPDGKEQKIPFNYKSAVKSGDMQGVSLMPGDTIVVP